MKWLVETNRYESTSYKLALAVQETDPVTGFSKFDLRQYSTLLARWHNPDPMQQYHSAYLAMGNNPISRIDPTGGFDDNASDYYINGIKVSRNTAESAMRAHNSDGNNFIFSVSVNGNETGVKYNGKTYFGKDAMTTALSNFMKDNGIFYNFGTNSYGKMNAKKVDYAYGIKTEYTFNEVFTANRVNIMKEVYAFKFDLATEGNGNQEAGSTQSNGGYNIDNAIKFLNLHAYSAYDPLTCGKCAKAVRLAIEEGGINTSDRNSNPKDPTSQYYAKNWGSYLSQKGFSNIKGVGYTPLKGDIRVWESYPGQKSKAGHIDMYNGDQWLSDFKQNNPIWPGGHYRKNNTPFQIFRWGIYP